MPLGGPAPYEPVRSCYSDDRTRYEDESIQVSIEQQVAFGTNIYIARVKLTDPSQLRTATAGKPKSKVVRTVGSMAAENNAVFAINGDFFSYHNAGVIVRNGEVVRESPALNRDTLWIDKNGDFHYLTHTTRKNWEEIRDRVVHSFSFGPVLMMDGEVLSFNYREKVSCGYPTKAQRMAIGQTGPLEYIVVATEGPEQDKRAGLSIPELVEVLQSLGVTNAYNMDGGSSVTLVMGDTRINAPESKDRKVSDIIYFATLVNQE